MDASTFLGPAGALAIAVVGGGMVWRRLEKADAERLARETADRAERLAREAVEREERKTREDAERVERHERETEWKSVIQANTLAMQAMQKAAEVMATEMRALLGTREGDRGASRREVSQPAIDPTGGR